MVFWDIAITLFGLIGIFLFLKLMQLRSGNKRVRQEIAGAAVGKMKIGAVKNLRVLPLIDFYASHPSLRTEAGVSYLIQADDVRILMDVGFNRKKEHPSPLLQNCEQLNISLQDLDMMFISHCHLDHVGGMREQKNNWFSISQGKVDLPEIPVYAPVPISPSPLNPSPTVNVINTPKKLAEGVAGIGSIPRNLFLMGYTLENSLAVNVEGKGIVLIIGCGHQTIERIIERTQDLFEEPIYGVIGGLHYPVRHGRIMLGPLNIQNIVGSDRPPWSGIGEADVTAAIRIIRKINPQFIALSPHDSSDWSIEMFRQAFGDRYHDVRVGLPMEI